MWGWFTAAFGGTLVLSALKPDRTRSSETERPAAISRTITVPETAAEAYAHWRKLENLPALLTGAATVKSLGLHHHSWSVRGKLGLPVTWETKLINDQPARLMEWRSTPESPIRSSGSIRFTKKKGNRGTKIHLRMTYVPATGFSAEAFNKAVQIANTAPLRKLA